MDRWNVRDGNDRDMERILSLRELVFKGEETDKLDPRFWRWQIKENPDGVGWIYLAEGEDKVIGHLADLPKRFSIQGDVVLGTLTHDMMVHPDYRRKGISFATARYGIEKVQREKGRFMTAYSVREESLNSLIKAGWKEVVKLPVLVFPIRFHGVANRYLRFPAASLLVGATARFFYSLFYGWRKISVGKGIELERVYEVDESFDRFWEKTRSLYPIMGNRSRSYLTWRYLRHPTRDYVIYRAMQKREMQGYIVLRKVELLQFNSAVIVDLLALDDKALGALVEKGIDHSRQEGVDLLGFMVPKPHHYYRILKKGGFLPSFKTFSFLVYSIWKEDILLDPKRWYINWGDTDVI